MLPLRLSGMRGSTYLYRPPQRPPVQETWRESRPRSPLPILFSIIICPAQKTIEAAYGRQD